MGELVSSPNLSDDDVMTVPDLRTVADYLRLAGWSLEDEDGRTTLWRPARSSGGRLEIVLPAQQETGDYAERISSALQTLAYSEQRLPEEITADMTLGGADAVAVRLTPNTPAGQAPLPLVHSAVAALHNYVVASTVALEIRDVVLPSRHFGWAEAYARQVRLSTQPGSFIMRLALPLSALVADDPGVPEGLATAEMFELPPQPLGRRVTNRMLQAAQASQQLADSVSAGDSLISDFGPSAIVPAAANSTELAALAALGGSEYSPYQLRFAQSPLAADQVGPVTLRVTGGQQRVLETAANYLRQRQLRSGVTVQGQIVRLYRPGAFGPGEIVVEGHDDESATTRRWHIELAADDYAGAVEAHLNNLQVLATGNREERGTHLHLRQLSAFTVIAGLQFEPRAVSPSPEIGYSGGLVFGAGRGAVGILSGTAAGDTEDDSPGTPPTGDSKR
jgi:hypothetical protein